MTALYDTEADPGQTSPIGAPEVEERLVRAMLGHMQAHAAPAEAYLRLDLAPPG